MKRRIKKLLAACLAGLMLLSASCGQNDGGGGSDVAPDTDSGFVITEDLVVEEYPNVLDTKERQTLNVLLGYEYYGTKEKAALFMKKYPHITVNVTNGSIDYDIYDQEVKAVLQTSEAPDIVMASTSCYNDPEVMAALADLSPFMENDPNFDENDYFMRVFDAVRYDNRLFVFPMNFIVNFMVIRNVGEDTRMYYDSLNSISIFDMMAMNTGALSLFEGFIPLAGVRLGVDMFIDYRNRTCDFDNPVFIQFLEDAKRQSPLDESGDLHINAWHVFPLSKSEIRPDAEAELSQSYMFAFIAWSHFQYFFSFEKQPESYYSTPLPLANSKGQLLIEYIDHAFCITESSENKALAWEFIKFMLQPEVNHREWGFYLVNDSILPVYKPLLLDELLGWDGKKGFFALRVSVLEGALGYKLTGGYDNAIYQYMDTLSAYLDQPMYYSPFRLDIKCYTAVRENLLSFCNGEITAEEAAETLQMEISRLLRSD